METLAEAVVGASATVVAGGGADWFSSSASSEMGLRAGDRDAGLTVLLVAEGMDWKSCSSELAPVISPP